MMGIKDWVLSQLISNSVISSRPPSGGDSFLEEEHFAEEEVGHQGSTQTGNSVLPSSHSSDSNHENQQNSLSNNLEVDYCTTDEKKLDPLAKTEALQIKFLRVLQRLDLSPDNVIVAKVLYRVHLATMIKSKESDLQRANLRSNNAKAIASKQEASGFPKLDFSFRVLVLGKTGVGKSSTINSIFDQTKAMTDPFQPGTHRVREIVGTINGVKVSFIDTPGLIPSSIRQNRKILHSVKRYIRKHPPDIVLYVERLDLINMGYSDFPLLKLITEVFGSSIWFNTILAMTHSSSSPPEGSNGYNSSYDSYVSQCTDLIQHYIHQAISDSKLENPIVLVENHPCCKRNNKGEKILPNGEAWKSRFLLLCVCSKILGDVNTLLEFQESIELGVTKSTRLPSLPHLLSSFLRQHPQFIPNGSDINLDEMTQSELEEEDEYDQLPPIRILTKTQFKKLSDAQKNAYLDELDYRETLFLKKQLREEATKRKEKSFQIENSTVLENSDNHEESPEAVQLPDMAVPPSFDSDCPVHRYRCLVTGDRWLARPVIDPHGWDHDVGFDGISLETETEIQKNVFTSVSGQMSKDKQDFSVQSEASTAFVNPTGCVHRVGLDLQSAGKDLIHTVRGNTKIRNLKNNLSEFGVSLMSFGDKCYVGTKFEDSIMIGKRLKLVVNGGRMSGAGQVAYGGNFETTLRGKDYPVRNDKVSFTMTVLSFNKETVLGGNLVSEFRLNRGTRMSVNANLNNRNMGQVCLKTSSSEHLEIGLIAVFSVFRALLRRRASNDLSREKLEME